MTGPGHVSVLTLRQRIDFAGLEGALSCAVEELRPLAQGDQTVEGLTPAEWSELADAAEEWRQSITDLLDLIAKHRAESTNHQKETTDGD